MQEERRDKSPLAIHHLGEMAQGSLPRKLLQPGCQGFVLPCVPRGRLRHEDGGERASAPTAGWGTASKLTQVWLTRHKLQQRTCELGTW